MKDGKASEFDGTGTNVTGIHDKDAVALSNGDKLRLGYITGQEADPAAPLDPAAFRGAVMTDPAAEAIQDFSA